MMLTFSVAGQNLRALAREKTPLPVLIHGAQGCMISQHARSFRASNQQIKFVDGHTTSVGFKSVAVSHCNLANDCEDQLLPVHLDSMKRLPFNLSDRPILPSDTAGQFHSRFYLPELRHRLIDVLAMIIAFGIAAASSGRKRNLLIGKYCIRMKVALLGCNGIQIMFCGIIHYIICCNKCRNITLSFFR